MGLDNSATRLNCPTRSCPTGGPSTDPNSPSLTPNNAQSVPAPTANPQTPPLEVLQVGTNPVEMRFNFNGGSGYRALTSCLKVPLKSGGSLNLAWSETPGYEAQYLAVRPDGWKPAGMVGVFSFLPVLTAAPNYNLGRYTSLSSEGFIDYGGAVGTIGNISYFEPENPLPIKARYNATTYFFTEYYTKTRQYFVYGGSKHPFEGRPIQQCDFSGNVLNYNYSARSPNSYHYYPLLRKLTGDIVGVTPYFQYQNEKTQDAPITKIYLLDNNAPSASRTVYFQYHGTSNYPISIVYPNGCTHQYDYEAGYFSGHPYLKKEVDAENYATYFVYQNGTDEISKTVEPDNTVTYYQYQAGGFTENKIFTKSGRPLAYYRFDVGSESTEPCMLTRAVDALGNVTYYRYGLASELPTAKISPRYIEGGLFKNYGIYYTYNSGFALTKSARGFDSATAYYKYVTNGQDVHSMIGPRNALGSLPVVTYYQYDANRNRNAVTDALGNTAYTIRDSAGRVRKEQDFLQNTTYYNYNATSGNLDTVVDAAGGVVYYKYNSYRDVTRVVPPRWIEQGYSAFTTYHEYDSLDRKTKTIDPLGKTTFYSYTSRGDLFETVDAQQTYYQYAYTGLRLLKKQFVRNAAGNLTTTQYFVYDTYKNRIRECDPTNNWTYYFYDVVDRLRAVRDAQANYTYYFYDACGNSTVMRDARNKPSYFFYDPADRRKTMRDATGSYTYYSYDKADNIINTRDARLNQTFYTYDALNRVIVSQDALNKQSYFIYDAMGNRISVQNARSFRTNFSFDSLNRLTSIIDQFPSSTNFVYDSAGNRTKILDTQYNPTYFFFDVLNRTKAVRNALGSYAYYCYDSVGNRTQVRSFQGYCAYFSYDGLNRMTKVVTGIGLGYGNQTYGNSPYGGSGPSSYFAYDAVGNRKRATSPRGYSSYFFYDSLNRLSRAVDPQGVPAYFKYDPVSQLFAVTDVFWRSTYFNYDNDNRASYVTDAQPSSVYFGYDVVGNRRKEVGTGSTYYNYDVLNRVSSIVDPLGKAAYYLYDVVSNLSKTVDNNQTAVYFSYNAVNWRNGIAYPAETQYFTYDGNGNPLAAADASGTSSFAFDPLNRMFKRNSPRSDVVYYRYDADSYLLRLQYPHGTAAAYYAYDFMARMAQTDSPAGTRCYYNYDTSSNILNKRLGNNVRAYFSYDRAERVTSIRYVKTNGTAISYFDFTRDKGGRVVKLGRENDLSIYYAYDSVDRLTGETWLKRSTVSQIYGFFYKYDPSGNRTRMRRECRNTEFENAYYLYAADNSLRRLRNLLPSVQTSYYNYDLNGALTKLFDGTNATYYEYGPHQLVTKITPPVAQGNPWQFFYDSRLNRYKANKGGTYAYYVWEGLNLLEERNASGNLVARYTHGATPIPGIGSIIEVQRNTATTTYYQYLQMDHRGTAYAVTDAAQNTQLSYAMDAFGRQLSAVAGANPTVPNEMIYQTNWMTVNIGGKTLCLPPAREYDPVTGRFMSRDPVPSMIKIAGSGGNALGIYDGTKLEWPIVVGANLSEINPANYVKWFMNAFRAWSSNPVSEVDATGLWVVSDGSGPGVAAGPGGIRIPPPVPDVGSTSGSGGGAMTTFPGSSLDNKAGTINGNSIAKLQNARTKCPDSCSVFLFCRQVTKRDLLFLRKHGPFNKKQTQHCAIIIVDSRNGDNIRVVSWGTNSSNQNKTDLNTLLGNDPKQTSPGDIYLLGTGCNLANSIESNVSAYKAHGVYGFGHTSNTFPAWLLRSANISDPDFVSHDPKPFGWDAADLYDYDK